MAAKGAPVKPAPAKTGGAPKIKQGKKPKKPKKPMPRFMLVVTSFLIFALLLAGAGYCLYADVGGLTEKAVALLPQYQKTITDLKNKKVAAEKDLAAQQATMQKEKDKIAADAAANAKTAQDLTNREAQLKADQQAFDGSKQTALAADEKKKAVTAIYNSLEPADAAAILMKAPTLQEAADILMTMSSQKVADILAEIQKTDAQKAYDLTKLIGQ